MNKWALTVWSGSMSIWMVCCCSVFNVICIVAVANTISPLRFNYSCFKIFTSKTEITFNHKFKQDNIYPWPWDVSMSTQQIAIFDDPKLRSRCSVTVGCPICSIERSLSLIATTTNWSIKWKSRCNHTPTVPVYPGGSRIYNLLCENKWCFAFMSWSVDSCDWCGSDQLGLQNSKYTINVLTLVF